MSLADSPLVLTLTGLVAGLVSYFAYYTVFANRERSVLKKDEFQKFPLIQKEILSKDSAIFRFGLPRPTDVLGLPIGQHIQIQAEVDGKNVLHSYTPTSLDQDSKGYFDLLIKVYPNGRLSKHLDSLKLGESINVKGPKGFYKHEANKLNHICMVAGGTGITPMYQLIKAILTNPEDNTKITLLYGSISEEDILLRSELDEFAEKHEQFTLVHFLDKAPENWTGKQGYVTKEALVEHFPKPADDVQLLICGPPGLVSSIKKASNELGFAKAKPISKDGDQVFLF